MTDLSEIYNSIESELSLMPDDKELARDVLMRSLILMKLEKAEVRVTESYNFLLQYANKLLYSDKYSDKSKLIKYINELSFRNITTSSIVSNLLIKLGVN